MKTLLNLLLVINGCILTIAGTGFILMYIWYAFIGQSSEAGQPLLFLYLPILATGLAMLSGGVFLSIKGIKKLKA